MDDLISKKLLLSAYDEKHKGPAGGARKLIEDAPTIHAVPLDKLCEWLAENSMNIPCASCQHMRNDYCTAIGDTSKPCPKDADDWRKALTNWMEELHAAD